MIDPDDPPDTAPPRSDPKDPSGPGETSTETTRDTTKSDNPSTPADAGTDQASGGEGTRTDSWTPAPKDKMLKKSEVDSAQEAKTYVGQQVKTKYPWADAGEDFKIVKDGDKYVAKFTDTGQKKVQKRAVSEKVESKYSSLDQGEDYVVKATEKGATAEFTEQGRREILKTEYGKGPKEVVNIEEVTEGGYRVTVNPVGGAERLSAPDQKTVELVPFTENAQEYFEDAEAYADVRRDLAESIQNQKQAAAAKEARETRERRNRAMEIQLGKAGVDVAKAEVQTGRDIDNSGEVTNPEQYLAQKFKESTRYDLKQGEDFEVVTRDELGPEDRIKRDSGIQTTARAFGVEEAAKKARDAANGDGQSTGYDVQLTDQGLSSIEQQVEKKHPVIDVKVSRTEDGVEINQVEQYGDTDWTPLVSGDPIEETIDDASATVSSGIDATLRKWEQAGGPQSFLYAMNPGALAIDSTQGTDVYGEGAEVATAQFAESSAQLFNVPGYASGGLEAVETAQYAAGGWDNAAAVAEAGVHVGTEAAEWAVDNPQAAVGAGLAATATIAAGSAAETAFYRRFASVTGRRVPSIGDAASMSFKQFKRGAGGVRKAGTRIRSGLDTVQSRTPTVRLEKDSDSGFVNVDASARRQIQDEFRVTGRQARDARDAFGRRFSAARPGFDDVSSGVRAASSRTVQALPNRGDLPSPGEFAAGAKTRARGAVKRPVGRANELARRIRREAVSARFKIAEKVRRDREVALRERAKQRARREVVNARFALSETVDSIERPSVREWVPSRDQALAMTVQKFEDVKRRGRVEAKNLEFRAAGAYRGGEQAFLDFGQAILDAGDATFGAGRRVASEVSDIDQYGLRVTASDDWKAARDTYETPDFSKETLLKNVDDRNQDIDAVGQLGEVEASGTATAADSVEDVDATATSRPESTLRDERSAGNSQSVRSRAGAQDARLVDRARVEQERGPLSRRTHDDARPTGAGGTIAAIGTLEDAQVSAVGTMNTNQVGDVAGAGAATADARQRLEAAQRVAAAGAAGDLAALEGDQRVSVAPGARIDTGIRVDSAVDTGQRIDQRMKFEQRTRMEQDVELTPRNQPDRPPRTPDIPGFLPDSDEQRGMVGGGFSEIQFTNPIASAAGAFFGGGLNASTMPEAMKSTGGMAKSKSKDMDLDVTGGEL